MANQRAKGQTLVAFPLEENFLAELDSARGDMSRSAYIREAISRMLKEQGRTITPAMTKAPDRAGKGGRPKKLQSPITKPQKINKPKP